MDHATAKAEREGWPTVEFSRLVFVIDGIEYIAEDAVLGAVGITGPAMLGRRMRGTSPPFVCAGRHVLYERAATEQWIASYLDAKAGGARPYQRRQ